MPPEKASSSAAPSANAGSNEFRLKVFARCRPPFPGEVGGASSAHNAVMVMRGEAEMRVAGIDAAAVSGSGAIRVGTKVYGFDDVFDGTACNADIGGVAADPLLEHALDGYNATIMCYGQTGTGKTHTMSSKKEADPGILFRSVQRLFSRMAKARAADPAVQFELRFTYVQLYRDNLQDLLDPATPFLRLRRFDGDGSTAAAAAAEYPRGTSAARAPDGPIAECTWSQPLLSVKHFLSLYELADKNRVVAETQMNKSSSRGHSVLALHLAKRYGSAGGPAGKADDGDDEAAALKRILASASSKDRYSRLVFVDLAGYERLKKTNLMDPIRVDEARHINLSLSALANVIHSLTYGAKHIPWRNSKLTQVLQTSIAGNSIASVVLALGPSSSHLTETLNTLHFGHNAIQCKTAVTVNGGAVDYRDAYEKLLGHVEMMRAKMAADSTAAASPLPPVASPERIVFVDREAAHGASAEVEQLRAELAASQARVRELERKCETQEAYMADTDALVAEVDGEMRDLQQRCDTSEREAASARRAVDDLFTRVVEAGGSKLLQSVRGCDSVSAYLQLIAHTRSATSGVMVHGAASSPDGSPRAPRFEASEEPPSTSQFDLQTVARETGHPSKAGRGGAGGGGGGSVAVASPPTAPAASRRRASSVSVSASSSSSSPPAGVAPPSSSGRSSRAPSPPLADTSSGSDDDDRDLYEGDLLSTDDPFSSPSTFHDASPPSPPHPGQHHHHHQHHRHAVPPPPPPVPNSDDDDEDAASPSNARRSLLDAFCTGGGGGTRQASKTRARGWQSWPTSVGVGGQFDVDRLEAWLDALRDAAVDADSGGGGGTTEGELCTVGDVHRFFCHLQVATAIAHDTDPESQAAVPSSSSPAASVGGWWRITSGSSTSGGGGTPYLHQVWAASSGAEAVPLGGRLRRLGLPPPIGCRLAAPSPLVPVPSSLFGRGLQPAPPYSLLEAALPYDDRVPRVLSASLTGECLEGATLFLHVRLSAACAAPIDAASADHSPGSNGGGVGGGGRDTAHGEDDDDWHALLGPGRAAGGTNDESTRLSKPHRQASHGTTIKWYRVSFEGGAEHRESATVVAAGATSYRCATTDVGCTILVEITPVATNTTAAASEGHPPPRCGVPALVRSDTAIVSLVPHIEGLRVGGDPYLGETLTASYAFKGGDEGRSVIRWYRSLDGQRFTLFASARAPERTLRVSADLVHHYIRVQVTPVRRDDTKGNVTVSKLVYVNVPPAIDDEVVARVSEIATGQSPFRVHATWQVPSAAASGSAAPVEGELRFSHETVCFLPRGGASKPPPGHPPPPVFRWADASHRERPYALLAGGRDECAVVWLDAATSCGGAAAVTSSTSSLSASSSAAPSPPPPAAHLVTVDNWQLREFVLLLHRTLFCLATQVTWGLVASHGAAADALASVFPLGTGANETPLGVAPDKIAADLQALARRAKGLGSGREVGGDRGSSSYRGVQRPGSERGFVAIVEECAFAAEIAAGKQLVAGGAYGGDGAAAGRGEPPRLPIVLPNLPGILF
jgi:hypothetical protein